MRDLAIQPGKKIEDKDIGILWDTLASKRLELERLNNQKINTKAAIVRHQLERLRLDCVMQIRELDTFIKLQNRFSS
jgi:hypothetical protein